MNKSSIAITSLMAIVAGLLLAWMLNPQKPIEFQSGSWFGDQARSLPAFELVDQRNQSFTNADLEGKWNLMFFGFTHCPDICPATLQILNETMNTIDEGNRESLQIIFVSVDPERDSAAKLASYMNYFNPKFIAATGEIDKLRVLTKALGINHRISDTRIAGQPADAQNYVVEHSSTMVLINPSAEYSGVFSSPHDPVLIAADLTQLLER